MIWDNETDKLRDEIITTCHAWSVPFMYEKMNELVTSAYERGLNDGKKNKQVDKEFQAMLLTGLSLKDLVVEEK